MSATTVSPNAKILLITGANKGIGYAVAEGLLSKYPNEYHILIGSRSPDNGASAVAKLQAKGYTAVEPITIDITDDASIAVAATKVRNKFGRLDILINNAGISVEYHMEGSSLRTIFDRIFQTNLYGQICTTEAFLPLLEKSSAPRLVFVTSDLGSLGWRKDSNSRFDEVMFPVYRSSKAALNMWCLHYCKVYRKEGDKWKINVANPGYTATDLNGFSGPNTVEEGARPIIEMTVLGKEGETGVFWGEEGEIPW